MRYEITNEFPHEILKEKEGPLISLYQPTHRHRPEASQDPIRFKNLIQEIEDQLEEKYEVYWVTELTDYESKANYYLAQTGLRDKYFVLKMMKNLFTSIKIWIKEKPDYVITTGTMIAIPTSILAKVG